MARHRWVAILITMPAVAYWLVSDSQAQTRERPFDLELRIDCSQQNIRCGDEIPIVFTIKNKDSAPFPYEHRTYDRSGRMYEYELIAKHLDGRSVPDPRGRDMPTLGGGLGAGFLNITTGLSVQQTIPLNLWARIIEPGRYSVTGIYHYDVWDKKRLKGYSSSKDVRVRSSPIEIEVKPRSREEMGEYIRDLTVSLVSLEDGKSPQVREERECLAARLAYTCDMRIVPTMLDLMYDERPFGNESFQAFQAFWCYLPRTREVRTAVLNTARARGLAGSSMNVLERLGCSEAEMVGVIRLSIASKDPNIVQHGVLAAQSHPADEFMPRLIAIAAGAGPGNSGSRGSAIYAIANHRTDEGIAALKNLLNDPNAETRKFTSEAVRQAYRMHPVYPEKVDEAFTKALVALATDPGHARQYSGLLAIAKSRTPDGVKAIKALLVDPNADVSLAATDLGVRTIRDLLHDNDPNVRERTRDYVEAAYHEYPGRPLRPDDFPPEFQDDPERFKQRVSEGLLKDQ